MIDTIIEKITGVEETDEEIIRRGAGIIQSGGLVAFPTETVYGLGGDAFDESAAGRIYAAKGRPSDNPLIVHIADIKDADELSDEIPDVFYTLAAGFWPGPLTMIVKKKARVPYSVTGGLDTVAIRFPSHSVATRLIKYSNTYIAAPSANLSGRPSPTTGEHVIEDLSGRVDMIIDDGGIDIGLESTIVDLTEGVPVILRPGYITKEMLEKVVGEVRLDPALMTGVSADVKPKAPGMKYRHYAPKAEMTVFEGSQDNVRAAIIAGALSSDDSGTCAILCHDESAYSEACKGKGIYIMPLGALGRADEIARNLFAALRRCDDFGVTIIYSESFEDGELGMAIMNRLLKAAGHHVVKV